MKTERKGYQKAVLVIAVFTILAGALYATDNFRKIPQNKSGSSILKRNEHGQGENLSSELVTKQADEPVDILITLGNAETETAVDYLQADTSYKRQFMIYGEGCSDKTVYYLDKGIIKSLVVPNEFNMGYQSVHTIAEQIKYKFSSAESTTVDSLVINRQNLYDEENQKTLFPIVQ